MQLEQISLVMTKCTNIIGKIWLLDVVATGAIPRMLGSSVAALTAIVLVQLAATGSVLAPIYRNYVKGYDSSLSN